MDTLKEKLKEILDDLVNFTDKIQDKQKKLILVGLGSLLLGLLFLTIVPRVGANIRETQLSTTVTNEIVDYQHFLPVEYDGVTDLIINNENVTLLLVDSNSDKMYKKIKEIVHDENNKELMTTPVYVYPLVYNKPELTKFFRLKNDVTLLHFKNQTETYRVGFESIEEISFHFMDFIQDIEEANKNKEK